MRHSARSDVTRALSEQGHAPCYAGRMPRPPRFVFVVGLSAAIAATSFACDGGDDTVRPAPTSGARQGGAGGAAGKVGGGAAGAAVQGGASGNRSGGAGGSAAAGGAGGPGTGGSTAGAAGAGTSGAAGAGGGAAGSAGASPAGGAGAGGASAGAAGIGGTSAGSAGSSAAGNGGAAGAPVDPYTSACASLESTLLACETVPDAEATAAGTACRESKACAEAFYGDKAPAVLACSQVACRVPKHVDQPMYECMEMNVIVGDAKIAFATFKDKGVQKMNTCKATGFQDTAQGIAKVLGAGVPEGARPEVFAALASCLDEPCPQVASCITDRVAAYCTGTTFFWSTSLLAASQSD